MTTYSKPTEERARRAAAEFRERGAGAKAVAHLRLAEHLEAASAARPRPAGQYSRLEGATMTNDLIDALSLRIAALQLLLAALSPDADHTNEFTRTVLGMLDPVVTEDGRTFVDVGRLRFVLNEAVAEARRLATESEENLQSNEVRVDEDRLLIALLHNSTRSIADLARAVGWVLASGDPAKSRVHRALERLEKAKPKLVANNRGGWALTDAGKMAAKEAAADDRG